MILIELVQKRNDKNKHLQYYTEYVWFLATTKASIKCVVHIYKT